MTSKPLPANGRLSVALIVSALAACAGSVHAQTAPQTLILTSRATASAQLFSATRAAPALAYSSRDRGGQSGFAQTSISRRLSSDGPIGSLGYLCGIKPFAPDYYGVRAGPASGFERGLTFLGVKLDYAFR